MSADTYEIDCWLARQAELRAVRKRRYTAAEIDQALRDCHEIGFACLSIEQQAALEQWESRP